MRIKDVLKNVIPREKTRYIPTSFDIIGEIAIVEIPEELEEYKEEIGKAILKIHRNVKCVYKRASEVKGEFRLRSYELIAGEEIDETIHKESGVKMKLNVKKVYFSPRLSQERLRIARKVAPGEIIIDLCAGIGSFSLVIAKHAKPKRIYAIDKNPLAFRYLVENIKLNKLQEVIFPFLGDCREVIKELNLKNIADRCILDYPSAPEKLFESVVLASKEKAFAHVYKFVKKEDYEEEVKSFVTYLSEIYSISLEVINVKKCGDISPSKVRVCVDLKIEKKSL